MLIGKRRLVVGYLLIHSQTYGDVCTSAEQGAGESWLDTYIWLSAGTDT